MLLWLGAVAMAGDLYINGTFVDPRSVAGVRLDKVTVEFDEQGNTRITAPGYRIKVVDAPAQGAEGRHPSGVARSAYWLVTEDAGTTGHKVDVRINGTLALTVRSGEPQRIVDIGSWLRAGSNQVLLQSTSTTPTGGTLHVFLGGGGDESGTVVMDDPAVQFEVDATASGPAEQTFTLSAR